jgi:hypothetical protein
MILDVDEIDEEESKDGDGVSIRCELIAIDQSSEEKEDDDIGHRDEKCRRELLGRLFFMGIGFMSIGSSEKTDPSSEDIERDKRDEIGERDTLEKKVQKEYDDHRKSNRMKEGDEVEEFSGSR